MTAGSQRRGSRRLAPATLAAALVLLASCSDSPMAAPSGGAAETTAGSASTTTSGTLATPVTPAASADRRTVETRSSTTTAAPSTSTTAAGTSTTVTPTTSPATTAAPPVDGATTTSLPPDGQTPVGPPVVVAPPSLPFTPGIGAVEMPHVDGVFRSLLSGNFAASVTVMRNGLPLFARAAGTTIGGQQVTPDSPMVLASVSKLITALTVARLVQEGRLLLDAAVPWSAMGLSHDAAWEDVTVRELLAHTSGMPVAGRRWLDEPGSCSIPLEEVISEPPRQHRGRWVYSNGNYCALGLLISEVTGASIDAAARELVFGPLGVDGPHLTSAAAQPDDAPYLQGPARLDRLGGAGTWMASTNAIATMLAAVTLDDMFTLADPGIMTDQYGWGHTGTVDGAKACAWRMDSGRTVVAAIVAGNRPSSGGRLCDRVIPAVAADLGQWNGEPDRLPNP